jgi:hypothetical protein
MPLSYAHCDGISPSDISCQATFLRLIVLIALFSACLELASLDETMATNEVSCKLA